MDPLLTNAEVIAHRSALQRKSSHYLRILSFGPRVLSPGGTITWQSSTSAIHLRRCAMLLASSGWRREVTGCVTFGNTVTLVRRKHSKSRCPRMPASFIGLVRRAVNRSVSVPGAVATGSGGEQHYRLAAWFAAPPLPDAAGFSMPCMPIQRTKASNQPVLVVSFGYIPKPWPPCS